MSASSDSFFNGSAAPPGAGAGGVFRGDLEATLGEKFGRLARFEFPIRFSLGSGYGHPRSDILLTTESKKPYFLFVSRDFRDENWKEVFEEKDRIYPSESHSSKVLTSRHPAFLPTSPLTKVDSGAICFSDVLYAVYFSQIAGALMTGSPLLVSRIKKLSQGCYQAKKIDALKVNIDLSARLLESASSVAFMDTGALHWILVSQLLRNMDGASSNIGEAGEKRKIALFDFDCFGDCHGWSESWGFRSADYVDMAAKIPPVSISKEGFVEPISGPLRWIDRHILREGQQETSENFHMRHYYYYFETQSLWRSVWLNPFAIREKWYLWLKLLTFPENWLNTIGLGFLGDLAFTKKLVSKIRYIREDIECSLPLSVLFRLDLLMNSEDYQKRLSEEYATYNEQYFPTRKPKNLKYRLTFESDVFDALEKQFLSPPAFRVDQSAEWNQNAACSYLQFLVVLGLPCFFKWRERVSALCLTDSRGRLDESHRNKLIFFKFLFNSRTCRERSPEQIFFLIQAFQLLYPTVEKVQSISWYHLPDFTVLLDGGEKKGFYFPSKTTWAFSHFSSEALTSREAFAKFPSESASPSEFGALTTNEAYLNMAELVRMGV